MDAQAGKPIIREVRIRRGETVKLPNDGHTIQEVTCDDIAKLALAMRDHTYFFETRRGLTINFIRDLNGSGTQGLYIKRKNNDANAKDLIGVVFDYTYDNDVEFLYEADLFMDQRKDYEPTINKGKHRFISNSADLHIDWNSDETLQWRSDIERLSRFPETLTGWIDANLEMLVRCSTGYLCGGSTIFTRADLERHVAAGLSLEDLKTRLKCSKCGKREARVTVF